MGYRELTRQEKTAIRKLVVQWCANYDRDTAACPWTAVLYAGENLDGAHVPVFPSSRFAP